MAAETQKLTSALTDIKRRREAARALAEHFGAKDLIIFVLDTEIGVLLPAPGFPQTLPQGARWQKFIKECLEKGSQIGTLPDVSEKKEVKATGFAGDDGSVLVLLGGDPKLDAVKEELFFLLIMLSALFRAERKAVTAEGKLQVSRSAAVQARELAEKLEVTRSELQRALVEAEKASRLKDEFLATVSHELRTPLNAILGWAKLLQNGRLDEAATEKAAATIVRNANSQAQMVEELLDISRIITGKFHFKAQPVNLSSLTLTAIDALRPAVEAKDIQLQTEFDDRATQINGDPDRLRQIIWNLLSNAVKFTPEGGLIEVLVKFRNSRAEIIVRDTGIGIEPEFLPFVFDRFRQSDGSQSRKYGGLGLGLAIVRQLVELHGGSVRAESAGRGLGAAFIVSLPLCRFKVRALKRGLQSDNKIGASGQLAGVRVLFVEDDNDSRELTSLFLKTSGAEVIEADSAAAALKLIKTEKFDVLISDIGMPDEDGYQLIKKIRQSSSVQNQNLPAIALTAYASENDRQRALEAGYHKHLAKPIDQSLLLTTLASLV